MIAPFILQECKLCRYKYDRRIGVPNLKIHHSTDHNTREVEQSGGCKSTKMDAECVTAYIPSPTCRLTLQSHSKIKCNSRRDTDLRKASGVLDTRVATRCGGLIDKLNQYC